MTTHFITAEIDLQESPLAIQHAVEAELQKRGEPLRWAVTNVDLERQKMMVEAIVTLSTGEGQAVSGERDMGFKGNPH
ncbi:MAG: hypothetical protein HC866_13605 [Leptolyngbyaceae cyanobacterium RU_5_1]|nr:hypothetical protein [Leptolyngbyaceae cyanobacterium RU_5_1]